MSPVSITLGDLSAAALEERRYPVSLFHFCEPAALNLSQEGQFGLEDVCRLGP